VKVWIFKGEIMEHDPMAVERRNAEAEEKGRGSAPRQSTPAPAPAE
jgi:small subunit ribosomal protein S3